jgi:hypothetical protein
MLGRLLYSSDSGWGELTSFVDTVMKLRGPDNVRNVLPCFSIQSLFLGVISLISHGHT